MSKRKFPPVKNIEFFVFLYVKRWCKSGLKKVKEVKKCQKSAKVGKILNEVASLLPKNKKLSEKVIKFGLENVKIKILPSQKD